MYGSELGGALGGGCQRRAREMLELEAVLRKVVAIEIARRVGLEGWGRQGA